MSVSSPQAAQQAAPAAQSPQLLSQLKSVGLPTTFDPSLLTGRMGLGNQISGFDPESGLWLGNYGGNLPAGSQITQGPNGSYQLSYPSGSDKQGFATYSLNPATGQYGASGFQAATHASPNFLPALEGIAAVGSLGLAGAAGALGGAAGGIGGSAADLGAWVPAGAGGSSAAIGAADLAPGWVAGAGTGAAGAAGGAASFADPTAGFVNPGLSDPAQLAGLGGSVNVAPSAGGGLLGSLGHLGPGSSLLSAATGLLSKPPSSSAPPSAQAPAGAGQLAGYSPQLLAQMGAPRATPGGSPMGPPSMPAAAPGGLMGQQSGGWNGLLGPGQQMPAWAQMLAQRGWGR